MQESAYYQHPSSQPNRHVTSSTTILPTGTVKTRVMYEQPTGTLYVTIDGARNLNARADGSCPNPFVKIYLLPNRRYVLIC